jgi:hypothetical protein
MSLVVCYQSNVLVYEIDMVEFREAAREEEIYDDEIRRPDIQKQYVDLIEESLPKINFKDNATYCEIVDAQLEEDYRKHKNCKIDESRKCSSGFIIDVQQLYYGNYPNTLFLYCHLHL